MIFRTNSIGFTLVLQSDDLQSWKNHGPTHMAPIWDDDFLQTGGVHLFSLHPSEFSSKCSCCSPYRAYGPDPTPMPEAPNRPPAHSFGSGQEAPQGRGAEDANSEDGGGGQRYSWAGGVPKSLMESLVDLACSVGIAGYLLELKA